MKSLVLVKNKEEETVIVNKLITYNEENLNIFIIADQLPLISNLSVIENIILPASYHRHKKIVEYIDIAHRYLSEYGLENRIYARKGDLNSYEIFLIKYISSKISEVDNIAFISPLNSVDVMYHGNLYDFFKNCNENYLILDYNESYNKYKNINGLLKMEFDEWLIQGLKV
ncbi:MAG: hypothetical protein LDL09_07090 [Calditerrivibrio sp.]|nr:hypothetical protein [Calditerrivibrio sp.]